MIDTEPYSGLYFTAVLNAIMKKFNFSYRVDLLPLLECV